MKVNPKRYHEGKPLTEIESYDGKRWSLELARTKDGRLVLFLYSGHAYHQEFTEFLLEGCAFCPPDEDEVTRHVRFAHKLENYESQRYLLQRVDEFIGRCLDLDDQHRFLLACFVLSTWVIDHLATAPYVAFVGLPGSGKSTALKTLQLLCRRGLITSDISSAAFYRACDRLKPTLFIDETASAGQKKALFHLLRSGTTREAIAFRGGESYCAFGAKAMAWRELPDDDALNSRCIVIPMRETSRVDLLGTHQPEMIAAADKLQGQLLLYRFKKCNKLSLPRIPGADRLRSRDRDLYQALGLAIGEDSEACTRLLECLVHERHTNQEPLPPKETAVLETLFKQIHLHADEGPCAIRHLTNEVNANLVRSAEHFRLNAKAVGAVLTTLGFRNRTRTNSGWVIWLDRVAQKRIHELMSAHGVDALSVHLPSQELSEPCDFCKREDPQCPETAPVGQLASEPTAENGPADKLASHCGERSEHSEPKNEQQEDLQAERTAGSGASKTQGAIPQEPRDEDNPGYVNLS